MLGSMAAVFWILRKRRVHKKSNRSEYKGEKNSSSDDMFAAPTVATVVELDDESLSRPKELDSIPKAELEARERMELEAINRAELRLSIATRKPTSL